MIEAENHTFQPNIDKRTLKQQQKPSRGGDFM